MTILSSDTIKAVKQQGVFVIGFSLMDLDHSRWSFILRSRFGNITI